MKTLEDFLRSTQRQLFKRLTKKFKGKTLISKGNFILVRGKAPVMLVAHLDTVHDEPVRDICTSDDGNILISPQGIGGVGAKAFCTVHKQHKLPNKHDAVYYRYANTDFETYITGKGFKTAQGSFSDISLIAPELGVAAVNLFSGYHNAHTIHEYINRKELNDTIAKVTDIIADASKLPRRIPADFHDIYEFLLDFYSVNELESFRAEFGDHILWQISTRKLHLIITRITSKEANIV